MAVVFVVSVILGLDGGPGGSDKKRKRSLEVKEATGRKYGGTLVKITLLTHNVLCHYRL